MAPAGPLSLQFTQEGENRTVFDHFMWTTDTDFRAFAFELKAAVIAAQVLKSEKINFLGDVTPNN